jgi:hypothetical protein
MSVLAPQTTVDQPEALLSTAAERVRAFRAWKAPWRDRDDIGPALEYVQQLREDTRLDRLYSE